MTAEISHRLSSRSSQLQTIEKRIRKSNKTETRPLPGGTTDAAGSTGRHRGGRTSRATQRRRSSVSKAHRRRNGQRLLTPTCAWQRRRGRVTLTTGATSASCRAACWVALQVVGVVVRLSKTHRPATTHRRRRWCQSHGATRVARLFTVASATAH